MGGGSRGDSELSPRASPSHFPGLCEIIGLKFRLLKQAEERGQDNPTPQAVPAQTDLQVLGTSQDQAQPGEGSLAHLEPSLWYLSWGFQSHALGPPEQSVGQGVLLRNGFVLLAAGIFQEKNKYLNMLSVLAQLQRIP